MNEEEFAELSAGHALGALSPEEERAYAAALAAHPEWVEQVALDVDTVAALAEGVDEVEPPAELRSRLLAQIAADARVPDGDAAHEGPVIAEEGAASASDASPTSAVRRRSRTRGMFALAASMALLVGLGWGAVALSQQWGAPSAVTALEQIEASADAGSATVEFEGGVATAHWSASVGKVVLVADGLPTLPADKTFELWYVRGDEPIPAGTFAAEGGADTVLLDGAMEPGDTIAVTVEEAGGSPDGTPTTDPILAIPTS